MTTLLLTRANTLGVLVLSVLLASQLSLNAADAVNTYPPLESVERFEIVDDVLHDTSQKVCSSNKAGTAHLLTWLKQKAPLPFDPKWQGSYRPILIVRFWKHGKLDPVEIAITHEWKDTGGNIRSLSDAEVKSLMTGVLKACQ